MSAIKKTIKTSLRLNIIILIAVILSLNTFAWFVYSTRISNSITAKVKAWRINFESGENQVAEYIDFNIDSIYPGMTTYSNSINIVNYSETPATLQFEINRVEILGDVYLSDNYTLEQFQTILEEDFPFVITFDISTMDLTAETGSADFTVNVSWAFESGDDVLDTYWGHKAYQFIQENPGDPGIAIYIKLTAVQTN